MFIGKGLQNAAGGYAEEAGSDSIWQFWVSLNFNLDYFFDATIMMIVLVYPVPILRNFRQLKIGFGIIVSMISIRLVLVMIGMPHTGWELFGLLYVVCGVIWGSIYLKFRLISDDKRNSSTENIAFVSALFLTLLLGHIWMSTPDMLLQSEYFYFIDLWGTTGLTSSFYDYSWQLGYVFGISVGLTILFVEISQAIKGKASIMLYFVLIYFICGMIRYLMHAFNTMGEMSLAWNDSFTMLEVWNLLTANLHFTVIRPLIAMFILLKFRLFSVEEENRPMARLMTVMLIVVATSAVLELIQTIIPINQMISAALMGVIIAFGVGWEEKSFEKLVTDSADIREGVDKKWFPTYDLPKKYLDRLITVSVMFLLLSLIIAFIYWQSNIYVELLGSA